MNCFRANARRVIWFVVFFSNRLWNQQSLSVKKNTSLKWEKDRKKSVLIRNYTSRQFLRNWFNEIERQSLHWLTRTRSYKCDKSRFHWDIYISLKSILCVVWTSNSILWTFMFFIGDNTGRKKSVQNIVTMEIKMNKSAGLLNLIICRWLCVCLFTFSVSAFKFT